MAGSWPADRVERWPVAKLVPDARNARTHSDEQITQLAASIEEWGWTIPVLVDEAGGIIAGHGRVLAAHQLSIEDVPVMVAVGWGDAKKRAYMLADNKLTLNGEWDLDYRPGALRQETPNVWVRGATAAGSLEADFESSDVGRFG